VSSTATAASSGPSPSNSFSGTRRSRRSAPERGARERAPFERRKVMRKVVAAAAMLVGTAASALLAHETAAPVAYVVMDADSGTILAAHDAHKPWPTASV